MPHKVRLREPTSFSAMKKILFLFCCLWPALVLTACGSDDREAPEKAAGEKMGAAPTRERASPLSSVPGIVETPHAVSESPPPPPATPEQKARADRMVAFHNTAAATLSSGWYALPDALLNNARAYLEDWHLAPRPAVRGTRGEATRALAPPQGLFTAEEEAQLARCVRDMEKALDAMLADYRALSRYVKDDSIMDDGVRGKKLAQSLAASHAVFMAARSGYLDMVKERVAGAENVLLRDHPLQRQIVAAERIFSLFRKAAGLLGPEKPDKDALEKVRQELELALARAGRPPFPAAPELERSYRAFLREAALFSQGLARGLTEGFYSPLRRELNGIAARSREAYNSFARAANES